MKETRKEFFDNGFCVLKNSFSARELEKVCNDIHAIVGLCANELNCSKKDYLKNVSRWVEPSPLTKCIYPSFSDSLKKIAIALIGNEACMAKVNLISKSPYATNPIPCHQDIAYSGNNPYQFSLWLALQDVSLEDGCLEFLPKSQLGVIEPAVDFWQPNFEDKMHSSSLWQQNYVSLPANAGDIIVFDSRIWHRSAASNSNCYRFALVSRWSSLDYIPPIYIPEKQNVEFGMWNCGELTTQLLRQGLFYCFNTNVTGDLEEILIAWQEKLSKKVKLAFTLDYKLAYKSLNDLLILHRATQLHNGGDAQGGVYPNLWHHFLHPLSQSINLSY